MSETRLVLPIALSILLIVVSSSTLSARDAADSVTVAADTTVGDSLAAAAAGGGDAPDSARVARQLVGGSEPAQAWKTWKDLSRAIRMMPLDGPDDILEKAEIIEDRIDDLSREEKRLEAGMGEWMSRHRSLGMQLEVLEDLAKVQLGGDLELQQRMHNMREGRRMAVHRADVFERSLAELRTELGQMLGLVQEYEREAEELRRREAEDR